jgi:cytoskeletal protein CcmA (bactofilin family)
MAMFGKDGRQTETRPASPNDAILSIIAAGTRVVGDWEGPGLIKVDGRVEGSISGPRQIIVGRDGSVQGNVQAAEVILAGTIDGSLVATERAELHGTATITGDVQTRVIVVHEGARINGTVRMTSVAGDAVERPSVQVMR